VLIGRCHHFTERRHVKGVKPILFFIIGKNKNISIIMEPQRIKGYIGDWYGKYLFDTKRT